MSGNSTENGLCEHVVENQTNSVSIDIRYENVRQNNTIFDKDESSAADNEEKEKLKQKVIHKCCESWTYEL